MNRNPTEPQPFISHLESLREDRGALACLRRGLGKPPGHTPEMFPLIIPYLPSEIEPWRETAYYLIASLFALHPESTNVGNLGDHFARARPPASEKTVDAVERRFVALLSAHPEDLPFYLRQAVSFLRSKEVKINWHQLWKDTLAWGHPERYVQRRWATAFWGSSRQESATDSRAEQ